MRKSLGQAVQERDAAQDELDLLKKKAATLDDELHFLKSDFSAKSSDVIERYSSQVLILLPTLSFFNFNFNLYMFFNYFKFVFFVQLQEANREASEARRALDQLRADNAALESALREEHARAFDATRMDKDRVDEEREEISRLTKLAEAHLQVHIIITKKST